MKFLFVYQCVLLLCAIRSGSTFEEMSLPKIHFLIQPIWVNKTYDESTNVSNYHMRFRGPSDTMEELGLISLVEVKKGDQLSLFESNVQLPLHDYMFISLKSASTSDTFKMSIDGNAKSGSKVQFPGQFCEFDMMGDISEQETAYLALKNGYCDSIPEKDLDIFVYFEVNFRKDNQTYLYKGKEEEDNFNFTKYVVTIDEINVVWLYINNKNTQEDGIQWDTPFISILVMDYSPISTEQDIITVYGWKKQVM